jgi:tetratricopeptide (TPR) repeat protein
MKESNSSFEKSANESESDNEEKEANLKQAKKDDKNTVIYIQRGLSTIIKNDEIQYLNKGNDLYKAGKYIEAISEYNKALSINPESVLAHIGKGHSLYMLSKFEYALKEYDDAIVINPKSSELYVIQGDALFNMRNYEEAIWEYDKALTLSSEPRYIILRRKYALKALKKKH